MPRLHERCYSESSLLDWVVKAKIWGSYSTPIREGICKLAGGNVARKTSKTLQFSEEQKLAL